jgi:hypothetical protein
MIFLMHFLPLRGMRENTFFRVGDFGNYSYKIYAKLVLQGFNID